jgi:hypothetical protein
MKKLSAIALSLAFCLFLLWAPASLSAAEVSFGKAIVVVFSQTGNTQKLADLIAADTGAEVYQIESAVPFPADEKDIIASEEKRRAEGGKLELKIRLLT